jgi:ABC-type bacteriocin/lantibiotic exporter with double-glycine peptidase domain
MRVPWLPTALSYDCGPACLAMVLAWHGRDSSVDDIRERLGTSRDGTTGFELVRVARELGMEARGVKAADPAALSEVPLPAIAHYRIGHFVVLEDVRPGRSVRVVDPMRGRLTLSLPEFHEEFSGVLVLFQPTPAFRRKRDRSWVLFLRSALSGRTRLNLILTALSLALQGMAFALPAAVAFVVDRIIPQRSLPAVALMAAGVPALVAGYALVAWIRGRAMALLSREVSRDLLDRIFRHLLRLPLPFFHGRPVEELVMRVQGADVVLDELLDQILSAFLDALLAATALAALFILYPQMSGLVIAAALLQGVLTWFAHRASLDEFIRDILSNARLYNFAAEALGGIADVKMIGIRRTEPVWAKLLEERVEARLRRRRRSAFWEGLLMAAQTGAQLLVLAAGAAMAIRGDATLGAVVAFFSLAGVCLSPVSALAAGLYRFRSTSEYLRRAHEILSTRPERDLPAGPAAPADAIRGHFLLRDVSFRFSGTGGDVLHGINLEIRPGEMVVIVGRTGSGKSTLAKILATLYEPTSGEMLVEGIPAARYSRSDLRAGIGCVFQENLLAGGTVHDNITLGREIPIEAVYDALDLACLREEVEKMPLILATPVGAGGLHLSGGQRQRLCLARAVAAGPRVMILDEATASVDRLTERRIYDNLDRLHCTRILVTHRLYVAAYADRVVVLEEGKIVQTGTHRELLAREGAYATMWERHGDGDEAADLESSSGRGRASRETREDSETLT